LASASATAVDPGMNTKAGNADPRARGAVASVPCETGAAAMTTAVSEHTTSSSAFTLVQQSGISFTQGGARKSCVMLSFTAEVLAQGDRLLELRAVLDGGVEASPGPVYFAQGDDVLRSRSFNFMFADVAPGPHRVELHFRNAGGSGAVKLGYRSAMLQFAR
jgi:hypothetical protein